ncbi:MULTISPECIES: serine hydrolase domain-containing protein [Mesonia]|uniref:Penicillin-binding protein PbpX n=1 Tax=Mesonia oceanica TaxID=2687242 RepID=A0AC61Y7F0_9FLAO|nr:MULTISPECIES: serine hydrolase domain-containing protein [Mesonia]MAN28189.1 serine hydrolase [Mesonia sp.]VVV00412.1 Putative penicillin-binding protein PbpX [Mesonia oceanica]|tara:strand:+ start:11222 stop:12307 length:1086 start_codon:yes stop_codon:yes gene_type:complete
MRPHLILLILTFTTISIYSQTTNSQIKNYLDSLNKSDFSGTILVAHNDTIIAQKAYGLSSIEYDVKNKIDTKFNIASITKMFTAVAALQLYEQGKIDLNTPIGKYLPDYPNEIVRNSVTVHQLLTHTSGLNNFYVTDLDKIKNTDYKEISDFIPLFSNDTLLSKPGTKYDYSGSGFVVLGLIIEKVSGENYYDYIRKHILKPSHMESTSEIQVDSIVKNKASGYTSQFGQNKNLKKNEYYLTKASPAGFYYSTVEDLFKFSKALRNHKLLTKETTDLMLEPKVKGYNTHLGYGIDIDNRYNQTIIGHSGGWYGIHCELMDFMNDHYTVVILSNIDDGGKTGASKVADFFKNLLAGKELKNN